MVLEPEMNFFKFLCQPFQQRALMFLLKNKNKFLCVSRMDYKKCNNFLYLTIFHSTLAVTAFFPLSMTCGICMSVTG